MNSPIYSYTSNPNAISRMGTVHYSRNNGNFSSVPMMPMYAGPEEFQQFASKASDWWQNLEDDDKQFIKNVTQTVVENRLSKRSQKNAQSAATQQSSTTSVRSGQGAGRPFAVSGRAPARSQSRVSDVPAGVRRPVVAADTFFEKISKNRFNIVLASSALLLGVIFINRRRQQMQ